MKADTEEPAMLRVKAIDVRPHRWAVWCSIENGPPFANTIVIRRWSEDGEHIWFMFDSHNFRKAKPDEVLELVPGDWDSLSPELQADIDANDARTMFVRKVSAR